MSRRCRKCNKILPASRYFNCIQCIPTLPNEEHNINYLGNNQTIDNGMDLEELYGNGEDYECEEVEYNSKTSDENKSN